MDDDEDDPAAFTPCPVCGADMDRVTCWHCGGAGGFHECGEDCCPHLHPDDDLNETCPECRGEGRYWECSALPHHSTPKGEP